MIDTHRRRVLEGIGAGAVLLAGSTALVSARGHAMGRGKGRGDGTIADVRVVHAIPDAPPVDVAVDGGQVLDEFPFAAISPYVDLEKGSYQVTVSADNGSTVTVFDQEFTLGANTDYTVAATGTLDGSDAADPVLVPFVDDNDPAPADAARVRAVHLSPDAPPVDIAVAGGGPVLIEDLSFREASDYIEVPGGDYTLAIQPAGSGTDLFTFDVSLENATTYSAFALGKLFDEDDEIQTGGEDGFRVVPTLDSESPAKGRGKP
jgi:hypothetical protein